MLVGSRGFGLRQRWPLLGGRRGLGQPVSTVAESQGVRVFMAGCWGAELTNGPDSRVVATGPGPGLVPGFARFRRGRRN